MNAKWPDKSPTSPKKAQLLVWLFFIKCANVFKYLRRVVHDAVLLTVVVKQVHQVFAVGAAQDVLRAVGAHILFFHAGKMFVQLAVKVLPVAVAQC